MEAAGKDWLRARDLELFVKHAYQDVWRTAYGLFLCHIHQALLSASWGTAYRLLLCHIRQALHQHLDTQFMDSSCATFVKHSYQRLDAQLMDPSCATFVEHSISILTHSLRTLLVPHSSSTPSVSWRTPYGLFLRHIRQALHQHLDTQLMDSPCATFVKHSISILTHTLWTLLVPHSSSTPSASWHTPYGLSLCHIRQARLSASWRTPYGPFLRLGIDTQKNIRRLRSQP